MRYLSLEESRNFIMRFFPAGTYVVSSLPEIRLRPSCCSTLTNNSMHGKQMSSCQPVSTRIKSQLTSAQGIDDDVERISWKIREGALHKNVAATGL